MPLTGAQLSSVGTLSLVGGVWCRILAVLRFFENCGSVLLDAVVCDGVIFGEQWYTVSRFCWSCEVKLRNLGCPGKIFEKWKALKFLHSKDSIHETL
jgi:hypothetical protein